LRLASKAFELDPEGDISLSYILDYTDDMYRKAKANKVAHELAYAKSLLIETARKCESRGERFMAHSLLTSADECDQLLKGRVD
jgi:hypothetical protein